MTTCDKDGGGVKKSWNSFDVIYGWPLIAFYNSSGIGTCWSDLWWKVITRPAIITGVLKKALPLSEAMQATIRIPLHLNLQHAIINRQDSRYHCGIINTQDSRYHCGIIIPYFTFTTKAIRKMQSKFYCSSNGNNRYTKQRWAGHIARMEEANSYIQEHLTPSTSICIFPRFFMIYQSCQIIVAVT